MRQIQRTFAMISQNVTKLSRIFYASRQLIFQLMRDTLYLLLIMSALNIGKNFIILYSISFLVSVIITDVHGQSYIETMKKNIAHLQCYEGIDLKVKARSCPAYSVTCSKVTICKIGMSQQVFDGNFFKEKLKFAIHKRNMDLTSISRFFFFFFFFFFL